MAKRLPKLEPGATGGMGRSDFSKIVAAAADKVARDPDVGRTLLQTAVKYGAGFMRQSGVGSVLMSSVSLAQSILGAQKERADSQSRVADIIRGRNNGDPSTGRSVFNQIYRQSQGAQFGNSKQLPFRYAPDHVREFLDSPAQAEAEKKFQENMRIRKALRDDVQAIGGDDPALYGKKGLAPELLTERERNEALDTHVDTFMQSSMNSKEAQSHSDAEMAKLRGSGWIPSAEYMALQAGGGLDAKRDAFKREYAEKAAKTALGWRRERAAAAEERYKNMTPKERADEARQIEEATKTAASYRSRHQIVEVD